MLTQEQIMKVKGQGFLINRGTELFSGRIVPCGTVFSIGGSAPPLVTIERSGVTALTNQTYASRTESMTFSTIPAGSMVIDLNKQTAAIGNTSIMQYYKPSSTWIEPKVGANQLITGNGTVKYRERWL